MGKLINRISGSHLLISSLPGSALRMHVESLGKPRYVKKFLKALHGKLDIKRQSPSNLYICGHLVQWSRRIQSISDEGIMKKTGPRSAVGNVSDNRCQSDC